MWVHPAEPASCRKAIVALQSWDQFDQCELADVGRRANDLKLNPLEHDSGKNRLIQDPSIVDKDLQLIADV